MVRGNWLKFDEDEFEALMEEETLLTRRASSGVNDIEVRLSCPFA